MKLLLCCNNSLQIKHTLEWLSQVGESVNEFSFKTPQHEITLLQTGYGGFQVGFHIATELAKQPYHLALKVGFANGLRSDIGVGEVVNIINDKPADTGILNETGFEDLYDSGLLNTSEKPHQMGGYVNKTNSYLNVFLPYRKVLSLSVNTISANEQLQRIRVSKYHPHVETTDGIYFAYACLWKQQPFYHLAAVEQNFATGEKNQELAHKNLNESLIDIIKKI